jgi:hypothetical protein
MFYLIFLGISIFVQTKDPSDFSEINQINYLNLDFEISEKNFYNIPDNSLVIVDDFYFSQANNKQTKVDFRGVVNYYLRHHNITLLLIIHNLYNNNLLNDILLAPHIFLAYSNLGYTLLR